MNWAWQSAWHSIVFMLEVSFFVSIATSLILIPVFWKRVTRIDPFLEACLSGVLFGLILIFPSGWLDYHGVIKFPGLWIGESCYTGELVAFALEVVVGNIATFLVLRFRMSSRG